MVAKRKQWQPSEVYELHRLYGLVDDARLAARFNVSVRALRAQASYVGASKRHNRLCAELWAIGSHRESKAIARLDREIAELFGDEEAA